MATRYVLWQAAAVLAVLGWIISMAVRRYIMLRKLSKLGARPPRAKTYAPLGLDFPINNARSANANNAEGFWKNMFISAGGAATGNYTVEIIMVADVYIVMTADPENSKALLATQFEDFGKGPRFHEEWESFLGDGIFATDGKLWHDSRALIRPMFTREKVADLDLVEHHIQKLFQLLGPGDGRQVHADDLMVRFALDVSLDFLFGAPAGSLDNPDATFAKAWNEVTRVKAVLGRWGPLQSLYPKKSLNDGLKVINEFVQPYIEAALRLSPEELETKETKKDNFLHALARFTRERKVLRDSLISLLLAGRDTTSSTMSFLFLELARNPRVVAKLKEEIQQTCGDSVPTYQQIKDMKYLNIVINETLRLYPPVPFNVRSALHDTTLPRGGGPDGLSPIAVPKNVPVGYSALTLHRRRDLYPPISETFPYDPLDWVPERWYTWTPKPWQFIPFNGGPRICIGQQFAVVEMGYTLSRILQEYDRIIDYGNQPILRCDITVMPANPVKVGFAKDGYGVAKS